MPPTQKYRCKFCNIELLTPLDAYILAGVKEYVCHNCFTKFSCQYCGNTILDGSRICVQCYSHRTQQGINNWYQQTWANIGNPYTSATNYNPKHWHGVYGTSGQVLDISIFKWCPYCDKSPPKFILHAANKYGPMGYSCSECGFNIKELDLTELFPMNKVEFIWKPDLGAYQVKFPFDKTMLEFLKSKIPSGYRTPDYDENGKFRAWLISQDYGEALLDILKLKFKHAQFTIITKEKVDEYNQGALLNIKDSPDKSLKIFVELLQKASIIQSNGSTPDYTKWTLLEATKFYRKAAMYYHPDRNPQLAADMSSLNKCWTELKGVYFK